MNFIKEQKEANHLKLLIQNGIRHFTENLSVDHKDIFEWTALHYACKLGNLEIV